MKALVFLFLSVWTQLAISAELSTNSVFFDNAPTWLTENKVNRVVDHIQKYMEWDIRKAKVSWYTDQTAFLKFHGYDGTVLAVSRKSDNTIHLGPRVTSTNFDEVFGHELVHIILFQKYRDAIPKWLEEGLANYVARQGTVNYGWLASQRFRDIRSLIHPFQTASGETNAAPPDARYHYQASTAMIEMIVSKCSLNDLLQLSVGEKLEGYLSTFCQIQDIDEDFKKWIKKKGFPLRSIVPKSKSPQKY